MREYVEEFTSVMLDIQNMSDKDKLHNFGGRMLKDLPGAIAAVDSLVDFWTTRPLTDVPSTSKTRKNNDNKGEWKKDSLKE